MELLPMSVGPLANLGTILIFLNRYAAAETALKRAVEIAPDDHELRLVLGQTQYRNEKPTEAIASFERVLGTRPKHLLALGGLLRAKLRICDWTDLDQHRTAFVGGLPGATGDGSENAPSPYTSLLVCDDPADCLAAARARSRSLSGRERPNIKPRPRREGDKIRVAYLSADYREHATSYLAAERKIAAETPGRSDCHLPEAGFIFCCFNNTFKILPDIFDVWMRLLGHVPGSVLWLLETDKACRENLLAQARARGVDEARLIFAPRLPNDRHLARLCLADLFLDTIPYNAHTLASDALWQGVPVVTCTGRTFASRVATSLLHNVGLPELATANLAEYEALALRLALDPAAAQAIRQRLRDGRATAALFDTGQLARDIERAYREMLRRAYQGLPPEAFDVRHLSA